MTTSTLLRPARAAGDAFAPTTEAALADPRRAAAIEDFWRQVGRFGHFTGKGGLALACAAFAQPDVARERGAVVVVNGRTESIVKYPEVAFDLWHAGHSVYLYDHRGQGLSAREPAVVAKGDPQRGHVERFDDYVDDLETFVSRCVLPAGHRRHFLLAHSMGGLVAALLLERPAASPFGAAALCSPMLAIRGFGDAPLDAATRRGLGLAQALGLGLWYAIPGGRYRAVPFEGNPFTRSALRYARWREAYERHPEARLGAPTIGWLNAADGAMRRACEDAGRIRVPVLALVAGADRIVHPCGVDAFWPRLGGAAPHARLLIEGARHELLIESDAARERALAEVLGFFSNCAG